MKTLLIEGATFMAKPVKKYLEDAGNDVIAIVGIQSLTPLVGIDLDGQPLALDAQQIDVALVGNGHNQILAPQVVKHLKSLGVQCVACSAMENDNAEMVSAGAQLALSKGVFLAAMYTGSLSMQDAINPTPELEAAMQKLSLRLKEDVDFRRALDRVIMP